MAEPNPYDIYYESSYDSTEQWIDALRSYFDDYVTNYYEQTDPVDDIDRIYRQEEVQEWYDLLSGLENGTVTTEEFLAWEPYYLKDIDGFTDYVTGIKQGIQESEAASNPYDTLLNEGYTQSQIDKASNILETVTGAIPTNTEEAADLIKKIITKTAGVSGECQTWTERATDPETGETYDGWQDCVNVGAILSIPGIDIPLPPGMVDVSVRDIVKTVEEAGQTWDDFISDPTGWITDKIEEAKQAVIDAWGDITSVDPKSSSGLIDILTDWGGSVLSGIVFNEVKDALEVENPFLLAQDCEDPEFAEQNKEYCDSYNETIAPNGYCQDGVTPKQDPSGTNCPEYEAPISAAEQECDTTGRVYDDLNDVCTNECINPDHVVGADGSCGPAEVVQETCTNNAVNSPDCTECADGSSPGDHQNGDCNSPLIVTETPSTTPSDPVCEQGRPEQGLTFGGGTDPDVLAAQDAWDARCGDAYNWDGSLKVFCEDQNADNFGEEGECVYPSGPDTEECPQGQVRAEGTDTCVVIGSVCDNGAGTYDDNGVCVYPVDENPEEEPQADPCDDPVYAAENPVECGGADGDGSFNCESQNRETNEDGSCGECLPGYVPDPEGFDQCVRDETEVPVEGTPETPEEEETSGGGGSSGGGGDGSSLFSGLTTDITAAPNLLQRQQFPITDYLTGLFTGIGR